MNKMNLSQAKAVILVTKNILGDRYKSDVPVRSVMTELDKLTIINGVCELFRDGVTGFNPSKDINAQRMGDPKELRIYVVGLCNNHWRKHKELNGGVPFVPSYTRSEQQAA